MVSLLSYLKNTVFGEEKKKNKEGIVEFLDINLLAEDCMQPRSELEFIDINDSFEYNKNIIIKNKEQFLVVYEDTVENIIGVLDVFDMFEHQSINKSILHRPNFITYNEELKNFYTKTLLYKTPQLVVNEFGDIKGIINSDTILKNIFEASKQMIIGQDGNLIAYGKMSIKYFQELMNINLDIENINSKTLSGFIMENFGYLPTPGEKITTHGLLFEILEIKDRYIFKAKVTKK